MDAMNSANYGAQRGDASSENIQAIVRRGNDLRSNGDLNGAVECYLRAAERGSADAAFYLAHIQMDKGDIVGAEKWYTQAAEAGSTGAMFNLANLLRDRENVVGAEKWYTHAAEAGYANAMNSLGALLKSKGNVDEAQRWYMRAAEDGHAPAMFNLGLLLTNMGDHDGAKTWYVRAAQKGNVGAMETLGYALKNTGDLDGAQRWYTRAAEAGSSFAQQGLAEIQRKQKNSDRLLDAIEFERFDLQMSQNADGFREWRDHELSLSERFYDTPPDLETLNAEGLRESLLALLELAESPMYHAEILETSKDLRSYMPRTLPQEGILLDCGVFEVASVKCVQVTTRQRTEHGKAYLTAIMVLFAQCFWILRLEIEEDQEFETEREFAVVQRLLDAKSGQGNPEDNAFGQFDPYDARWDGIIPIDHDPLTRMRTLVSRMRESIRFGDATAGLEAFITRD